MSSPAFGGRHRQRRRRSQRQVYWQDWFFTVPWLAVTAIGLIILLRYVLLDWLVQLEVLFELQIFRLFLLVPCLVFLLYAAIKNDYRLVAWAGVVCLILAVEAWQHIRLVPNFPRSVHARTDLRVFTQNTGMSSPQAWSEWLAKNPMDLVFLQEVYIVYKPEWEEMAARFKYENMFQEVRSDAGMGGMILSKYPLTELDPIPALSQAGEGGRGEGVRYFIRALINYKGTDIEVIGLHLESFHMAPDQPQGFFSSFFSSRNFFTSAPYRQVQAETIAAFVEGAPHPVIVAGDFNAPPTFRSTRALRGLLSDAWTEAGCGLGSTFPAQFPLIRIDAILYRGLVADYAQVVAVTDTIRDHQGVTAILNLDGSMEYSPQESAQ